MAEDRKSMFQRISKRVTQWNTPNLELDGPVTAAPIKLRSRIDTSLNRFLSTFGRWLGAYVVLGLDPSVINAALYTDESGKVCVRSPDQLAALGYGETDVKVAYRFIDGAMKDVRGYRPQKKLDSRSGAHHR